MLPAAAGSEYASFSSVRNDYESGDIALGDVKKQTDVYEHGDIALGRNDASKAMQITVYYQQMATVFCPSMMDMDQS